MSEIRDAVMALDVNNDAEWTRSGLPAVEAVNAKLGADNITRDMITEAVGSFTRQDAMAHVPADEPTALDAPVSDTPFQIMERFCSVCGGERYRGNHVFQQIVQMWTVESENARDMQGRLDERHDRMVERNAAAKVDAFEEAHAEQLKAEAEAAQA